MLTFLVLYQIQLNRPSCDYFKNIINYKVLKERMYDGTGYPELFYCAEGRSK